MSEQGLSATRRRFGLLAAIHDLLISVINRILFFRIQVVYLITEAGSSDLADTQIRVMSAEELQRSISQRHLDMPAHFIATATENGDQCFGAYRGDELIGYAWYAVNPVAYSNGFTAHFSPRYVHAYKNWTSPITRGAGLQKAIKAAALQHYRQLDRAGIVVAIDSHNFSSRRSTQGSGGKAQGLWLILRTGQRYFGFGTPGCHRVGYHLDLRKRTIRHDDTAVATPQVTRHPAVPLELEVSRIGSIESLAAHGEQLLDFLKRCRQGTGFFYQPDYLRALAPLYLRHGSEQLFFLVAKTGATIVAIAPLQRETKSLLKGRVRRLHVWGGILGSLNNMSSDILVADPTHAEAAVAAFKQFLTTKARNSWDILDLPYISEESYSLDSLLRLFENCTTNPESMETFTVDLPESAAAFRDRLPRKLLSDLRRRQNRMTEEIGAPVLRIANTLSTGERERIAELHRTRQLNLRERGTRRHSIFEIEEESKAFWSMVNFAESTHQARFYLLEAEHKIAAFFICFDFGGTLHHYLMALDEAYSKYAPSKLLMLFLAETEIEQFNTKVVNLSTGVNNFKQEFCNRHTRHWHLTIENRALNARLRLAVYNGLIELKRFINGETKP